MSPAGLVASLGGSKVLGREVRSELDLAEAIHEGLPVSSVDAVLHSGMLEAAELYALVAPRRTLEHRRKQETLSPQQSDRLARVVRVFNRAGEALASTEKASRWMRKTNRALSGKRPIDLLETEVGARIVEKVLGRIEHGVYS
ncbi:MAG TPA: antitoxin Xre/MbcA/ParS toxin-binding domain-containing protein [Longimicrobiaceae bacterium]|nr:antitoxin Xre/MbcA/ParS toxin-binding domain-containing protein [Longimicrobiaceae bacterium]